MTGVLVGYAWSGYYHRGSSAAPSHQVRRHDDGTLRFHARGADGNGHYPWSFRTESWTALVERAKVHRYDMRPACSRRQTS